MARDDDDGKISVTIETKLTDEKVKELFAWVSRAFAGDEEYNNLMLAILWCLEICRKNPWPVPLHIK